MKKSFIIVGLGFGDEGKGTMTDYLCRENRVNLVVRYNGGSQCGHNVVTDDGRHHTFAQFGSGSFVPGVRTLISKHVKWDPIALAHESAELSTKLGYRALDFHFIDEAAPVITPYHVAINRLREISRGADKHGSCGKGVGELAMDMIEFPSNVLRAMHLTNEDAMFSKLIHQQQQACNKLFHLNIKKSEDPEIQALINSIQDPEEVGKLMDAYMEMGKQFNILETHETQMMLVDAEDVVFEGAQGILLDQWHGLHPYTTWSDITPAVAMSMSQVADRVEVIGVTRAYHTRHGAGPFPTEVEGENFYPEDHNQQNQWQGSFRSGDFDPILFHYAANACMSLDSIAVTHLDTFAKQTIKAVKGYSIPEIGDVVTKLRVNRHQDLNHQQKLTNLLSSAKGIGHHALTEDGLIDLINQLSYSKVKYRSYGPKSSDKRIKF